MTEKDTWEPLVDPTMRVFAKWEEEQRLVFERDCVRDGVLANQQRKPGVRNEPVA